MCIYICTSVEEQKFIHMCTCMKLCVDEPRLACKFQKSSMCIYICIYTFVLRSHKSLAHALAAMCAIGSDDQPGTSLQRF